MDALKLFLACLDQLPLSLGGMGGARWGAVRAADLAQEARWLGLHSQRQASVVRQYRVIEREALHILNEREVQAARQKS